MPLTPATARELGKHGLELRAPRGFGRPSHYADEEYQAAGVILIDDISGALASADLVLRVQNAPLAEIAAMKRGAVHVSFLDPFNEGD